MQRTSRRGFLSDSIRGAAGVSLAAAAQAARAQDRVAGASERVVLALVGAGGRGGSLSAGFASRDDCRFAYVADVNIHKAEARARALAEMQHGRAPKAVQDFRRLLDDKAVDAIVVATPDHWHAPATVWGCQAGKDVYVEKPASHNCWEGRKMVQAARKHKRVVQVGTQNRSAPYNMAAKKYIADGKLGHVHLCRVFNMKYQGNFPMAPDGDPPPGLDWDMWNGPAPEHAYNPTLHRHWHHLWRYSGGDMANDGIHQIDLARWLCGVEVPKAVLGIGGRYDGPGAAETPDTQIVTFEFDKLLMTFELTLYTPYMLKTDGGVRSSDMIPYWPQNATRIEIYGTQGVMFIGRHGGGWQVYERPKDRKPVVKAQTPGRFPDPEHKENFIRCVRSRELPNADILKGHRSALLVHYGNIATRLGGTRLAIDPKSEQFVGNEEATRLLKRRYRKPWVIEDEV